MVIVKCKISYNNNTKPHIGGKGKGYGGTDKSRILEDGSWMYFFYTDDCLRIIGYDPHSQYIPYILNNAIVEQNAHPH